MFFPGSRYINQTTYQVTMADGTMVSATHLPLPLQNALQGYYQRRSGQRLDQIASHFLADATTFWRLCDGNDAMVPDALAVHNLIGIPGEGS
jgi:hypothetical protein